MHSGSRTAPGSGLPRLEMPAGNEIDHFQAVHRLVRGKTFGDRGIIRRDRSRARKVKAHIVKLVPVRVTVGEIPGSGNVHGLPGFGVRRGKRRVIPGKQVKADVLNEIVGIVGIGERIAVLENLTPGGNTGKNEQNGDLRQLPEYHLPLPRRQFFHDVLTKYSALRTP
ncbi:MAG: hypothetical protein BWY20_02405 [Spirochaetes bacterium ADurb.Bin215]|nr:MAG: hypothetical protein BWY20_02405 [Spirochaetes bacterium ADurb.Bin215]